MLKVNPAGIYLLKVNNRNTRTRCEIGSVILVSSLLTLNYFTPCSSASIVNFEHVIAGWEANPNCSIRKEMETPTREIIHFIVYG